MSQDNLRSNTSGSYSYNGKRRYGLGWLPWLLLLFLLLLALLTFLLMRNVGDDGDKPGIDTRGDRVSTTALSANSSKAATPTTAA